MNARPSGPASRQAVAIVTGGSVGAGRKLARELAAGGYAVAVVYLREQDAADAVVAEILAADGAAVAVRADITDELDVERLFDETLAAFGTVDVVAGADADDLVARLERLGRTARVIDQGLHGRDRSQDARA